MAIENDVHVIGRFNPGGLPQLVESLRAQGGDEIRVIIGRIIPPADYDFLYKAGAVGVFGPGTVITDSADRVLDALGKLCGSE